MLNQRVVRIVTVAILFLSISLFLFYTSKTIYEAPPNSSAYSSSWRGLSKIYGFLIRSGYTIKILHSDLEPLKNFERGSMLVIVGNTARYSREGIRTIKQYVERGGCLLICDEAGSDLIESFGVIMNNATVVDFRKFAKRQDIPYIRFKVAEVEGEVLLKFPSAILDYPENTYVLAKTSADSWIDENKDYKINASSESKGPFAEAVYFEYGDGDVIIVADSDIFTNDMIDKADNAKFLLALLLLCKPSLIIFDESKSDGVVLGDVSEFHNNLMNINKWKTLIFSALMLTSLFAVDMYSRKVNKRKSRRISPQVSEFRRLVEDIRKRFAKRYEPYNWIILMRCRQLRKVLLKYVSPKLRDKVDDLTLVSLVYEKKRNFDKVELYHLLKACRSIGEGKSFVKSLRETTFLERKLRKYIELLKTR